MSIYSKRHCQSLYILIKKQIGFFVLVIYGEVVLCIISLKMTFHGLLKFHGVLVFSFGAFLKLACKVCIPLEDIMKGFRCNVPSRDIDWVFKSRKFKLRENKPFTFQ